VALGDGYRERQKNSEGLMSFLNSREALAPQGIGKSVPRCAASL
jgi:hypothetical protein